MTDLDETTVDGTSHPILFHRNRFILYMATAFALGLLIAAVVAISGDLPTIAALVTIVPTTLVFAFVGLAAWYPCRALPIGVAPPTQIIATQIVGALVASGVWMLIWTGWMIVAEKAPFVGSSDLAATRRPLLVAVGAFLYLICAATYYLLETFEASRAAERAALQYRVLAREAELRAFKAQIDPHFLFNSLNSISALCGSSPADARKMTEQLASFFRSSLRLGREESIDLGRELDLLDTYLAIEKVRFGSRLASAIDADDDARATRVPPLLLQPLVENAVRHGIAGLPDGGTIRITAKSGQDRVRIVVENDCDPDREDRRGEGIGLENVRGRLVAVWGDQATMRIEERSATFRASIEIPRTARAADEEVTS